MVMAFIYGILIRHPQRGVRAASFQAQRTSIQFWRSAGLGSTLRTAYKYLTCAALARQPLSMLAGAMHVTNYPVVPAECSPHRHHNG